MKKNIHPSYWQREYIIHHSVGVNPKSIKYYDNSVQLDIVRLNDNHAQYLFISVHCKWL